ncbi:MAG: SusC/RagA family TonB-linked outer membrane protein [Lewinellaceae bacterium]|nr:SusC/RagA family TonB-linked outer membrane protein [Lewinellaceae bacterium]
MKKILLLFVFLAASSWMMAQRTVTGTVTDTGGDPLIGANVIALGTTVGTITDIDGNFTINMPAGNNTIVVSYIGYEDQNIDVTGLSNVSVTMREGTLLEEVVVTALGTERNARSTVYANQTVDSEDLLSSPSKNTLEALRGKTAGVKITTGSGSVGASSKIVLRGESSLTGNNNALIVVDGVPIDNNSSSGGIGGGESGYSDYGNRFNDINPNDIENVTILKGPSATSLYGSRGASGVVLITTKSGKKDKFKVEFNSSYSADKAYVLLQRQDQYGQGILNPDGSKNRDSGENFSWGPKFDGVVRPWTSPIAVDTDGDGINDSVEYLSRPYSAVPNQLDNFFRIGNTAENSISFSGGKGGFKYYASYGNTQQQGILDNTDYSRNNFNFKASADISSKFRSGFNISYAIIDQNTAQEGSRAFEGQNPYASAVQAPVNIPYNELKDYTNKFHSFDGYYGSYAINPYFILNEYQNNGKINNLLAGMNLAYDIMDNLTLSTNLGSNIVNTNITQVTPVYQYNDHYVWEDNLALTLRGGRQGSSGSYSFRAINSRTIDWTNQLNYLKNFGTNDRFALNLTLGSNIYDITAKDNTVQTVGGLVVPGVYNLANSAEQPTSSQNNYDYRIIGFFGNANFGIDEKLFFEYSARKDYSSTLPLDNQGFFYQAIGANAILSEYLNLSDNSTINFLKVRASYGTTGKDAGRYLLNNVYFGNPTILGYRDEYLIRYPLSGQAGFSKGGNIGNPELKPELTTTAEFGIDMGLFKDIINLNYTYYNANHDNQIVVTSLPSSSGYTQTAKNVGKIVNKGHEIGLNIRPLGTSSKNWDWDIFLTYSTNKNEVVKISDETDELVIWDSGRGVTFVAEEGQPYGVFKSQVPLYTDSGQPIVTSSGIRKYSDKVEAIGSYQPDWIGSLGSGIGYKKLKFNFLLDVRQGGKFFSLTKSATEFNGTSMTTLIGDREPFVVENSVVQNEDGSYSPNTQATEAYSYLFDGNYGNHMIDASFIKLREVGLSYSIPNSITSKLRMSKASIGIFGKNLKFWLPEENTFADPEIIGPGTVQSNIAGVETTQTPPTKSYGIRLNVQF